MSDDATNFLTEWSLKREPAPVSRTDAVAEAAIWAADAEANGISADDLAGAAGSDVAEYLLRTYGEVPSAE